jgi:hypothetical protein
MAKTQTNLRLAPEALEAAREAAKTRGIPLNEYVERLITEDTSGARGRGMAAAQRIIDDFGSFLGDLEQELDHGAPHTSGSAAA